MSTRIRPLVALAVSLLLLAGCAADDRDPGPTGPRFVSSAGSPTASSAPATRPGPTSGAPGPGGTSPAPGAGRPGPGASPTPVPSGRAAHGRVGPFGTTRVTGSRKVALTFDDGPHPVWTPKVLDALKAAKVKATFCLVGVKAQRYPELVARIVREGHSLCNHSWSHDLKMGEKTVDQIRADLVRTNEAIRQVVPGVAVPYYRQPGGMWTPEIVGVARELGMVPLHWDVDPNDWEKPGAQKIIDRVAAHTRPGSIVLLHDGGGDRSGTVGACPKVLASLKARYGIVRLR